MPHRYISAKATAVHTGTPEEAMRALFIGKSNIITNITTSIEMSRSRRNDHTELPTTAGWSVIRVMVTLSGKSISKAASTLSTSLPNETILLSGRILMESTKASCPLKVTMAEGSLYRLSMVAISLSLRLSPSLEVYMTFSPNSFSLPMLLCICTGVLPLSVERLPPRS